MRILKWPHGRRPGWRGRGQVCRRGHPGAEQARRDHPARSAYGAPVIVDVTLDHPKEAALGSRREFAPRRTATRDLVADISGRPPAPGGKRDQVISARRKSSIALLSRCSRGSRPARRRADLAETPGRDLGTVLGLEAKRVSCTPDLMPGRHHRLRSARGSETGGATLRSLHRARYSASCGSRRDQPRQPAHAVGAAAGDAGHAASPSPAATTTLPHHSPSWRRRTPLEQEGRSPPRSAA